MTGIRPPGAARSRGPRIRPTLAGRDPARRALGKHLARRPLRLSARVRGRRQRDASPSLVFSSSPSHSLLAGALQRPDGGSPVRILSDPASLLSDLFSSSKPGPDEWASGAAVRERQGGAAVPSRRLHSMRGLHVSRFMRGGPAGGCSLPDMVAGGPPTAVLARRVPALGVLVADDIDWCCKSKSSPSRPLPTRSGGCACRRHCHPKPPFSPSSPSAPELASGVRRWRDLMVTVAEVVKTQEGGR